MRNRSWQYKAVARQAVKYPALFPHVGPRVRWLTLVALIWGASVGSAAAERLTKGKRAGPSLLFGGGVQPVKGPVFLDPVLPRGELRAVALRLLKPSHCSLRRPVCVHSDEGLESKSVIGALKLLENAYEEHRFGVGLPPPHATFGDPLLWDLSVWGDVKVEVESLPSRGFDRGHARCVGGRAELEDARRCISASAMASSAPATASWLRDGYALHSTRRLGPADVGSSALRSSYAHPQVGVLTSSSGDEDFRTGQLHPVTTLRSARFFSFLDDRSLDQMGSAGWLALSLAATRTPAGASRWEAEPDILDVLLATVGGERTDLARLFDDFAEFSFFEGNEVEMPIELAWTVSSASLPRSLALPWPLQPSGSAYVKVSFEKTVQDKTIAFRITCEAPVSYVWSIIRLDATGEPLSKVPIVYRQRGTQAASSVEPQPGTHSLLLVGTNMGGVALSHPFDPDHGPHEGHGCSVVVNELVIADGGKQEGP